MSQDPLNPYSAPEILPETVLTPRGFTPARCAAGFTTSGSISGVLGGIAAVFGLNSGVHTPLVLAVSGILLGMSLLVSVTRYIGGMELSAALGLVIGCLAGLACMGFVFDTLWTGFGGGSWTGDRLFPLAVAPMIGMVLVAATVRIVGGFVRARMQMTVWLCGSLLGFVGFWLVQAVGPRTGWLNITLVSSMACFQAGLCGLIGWQLGTARSISDLESTASSGVSSKSTSPF